MGGNQIKASAEEGGEHPKQYQGKADHANRAVKQFAVKTQAAFEVDGQSKCDSQGNPCGYQLFGDGS